MPKRKKEKVWEYGMPKGDLPPYDYHVWFKGEKSPREMHGFDEDHIRRMCREDGLRPIKVKRFKKKEVEDIYEPLGPKGSEVNRPADYDQAFKLLKEYVDSIGGPPEELRLKIRELWVDYRNVEQKTTTSSTKKDGRHKI